MVSHQTTRHQCLLAIAMLVGLATPHLTAQQTPTDPVPVAPQIDLYYGTRHVNPRPLPVPETLIVNGTPAIEKPVQATAEEKSVTIPVVPLTPWQSTPWQPNGIQRTCAEFPVPTGVPGLLQLVSHVMNRMITTAFPTTSHTTPHPQIVIIRETVAAPEPGLLQLSAVAQSVATPAAQPTIVVVREPAETPTVEPTGIRVSQEMVAILGIGFLSFTALMVILFRLPKQVVMTAVPQPELPASTPMVAVSAVQNDEALLDGQYKMGPLPETAERFDIGPSYHEELLQQKHHEEASRTAVVSQMLRQNAVLFDEIAKEKLIPVVDARTPIAFHGIVLTDTKS